MGYLPLTFTCRKAMNLSETEKPRETWHKKIPNGILGVGLLLCVLGFRYAIYRSHAYPQKEMIKYYAMLTCGILLFGIAFKFSDDKKTNFVALYAEFLEFKDSKYKLIIPVVANNVIRTAATIRVSGNELIYDEKSGGNTADDGSNDEESVRVTSGADEAA